jgi:radical SAM superfamily enzyme YgiQ (UPF0313 family)
VAQVRTDVVDDPELLDLLRRSRCERLAMGLESVNQETLDSLDKHQSLGDIVRAIDTPHEYGIKTHGMLMLGADADTPETIRETVRFARDHHIDTLMLSILTPAPGTRHHAELDAAGRISERRWDLYDGQHVVFTPTLHSWYRIFLRRWRKEKGNRDYLETLKQMRPSASSTAAAGSRG